MLRLKPSSFAASATLSALSLGCSAKGRITASLCSATPRRPRPPSPIVAIFAFKSRTNFVSNVVRDLTTNVRYFSAMTLQ